MASLRWIPEAVLYAQSVLLVGVGLLALLNPESFLAGVNDKIIGQPTQLVHSISMLGLTLGCCFALGASHKPMHRRMLLAGIPLRLLATCVFWRDSPGTHGVALYEAAWAILDLAALPFT